MRSNLAEGRSLPQEALAGVELGWNDGTVELAIRDSDGKLVDIRRWPLAKRHFLSTSGCRVGLYSSPALREWPDAMVFVCEGEWDAIALDFLIGLTGVPAIAVAAPGAGTFKHDWALWLKGRAVVVAYDNDDAGRKGELRVRKLVRGLAAELRFLHWPDDRPDGYDVRDLVSSWLTKGDPDGGLEELLSLVSDEPRLDPDEIGDDGDPDGGSSETSHIAQMTRIAETVEVFRSPGGDAFATVELRPGEKRTVAVPSGEFRAWLQNAHYERNNRVAPASAARDVAEFLAARAKLTGPEHDVFVRVGRDGDAIWIDRAGETREGVRIGQNGWRTEPPDGIRFFAPTGSMALPMPVHGGADVEPLRRLLNLRSDTDWVLVLGWLVASLRPAGPYPVLVLKGEQGTAKSMTTTIIRQIADPSAVPIVAPPKGIEDLALIARHSWVVALDNISGLRAALSDGLCRLSTGGGFATRRLYTNDELFIFRASRPVILNGIDDLTTRADLSERALHIELEPIGDDERRAEEDIFAELDEAMPRILGGLYNGISRALRDHGSVRLERLHRMADAMRWMVAAEPALGLPEGAIVRALDENAARADQAPLAASPLVEPIEALLGKSLRGIFKGSPSELYSKLEELTSLTTQRSPEWPRSPSAMSKAIKRLAPSLRRSGVDVEMDIRTPGGKRREIHLRLRGETEDVPDPAARRERPRRKVKRKKARRS